MRVTLDEELRLTVGNDHILRQSKANKKETTPTAFIVEMNESYRDISNIW